MSFLKSEETPSVMGDQSSRLGSQAMRSEEDMGEQEKQEFNCSSELEEDAAVAEIVRLAEAVVEDGGRCRGA